MKAGLTIEELATEVMRQKDAKADYIVNTSMLAMEHCGTELVLRVLDDSHIDRIEPLDIADTAHRQIGTRLGIPAKYYGKMLTEHPDLLVTNVNAWFEREPTERIQWKSTRKYEQFRDWLSEHTHSIDECGAKFEMTGVHTVVLVVDKAA